MNIKREEVCKAKNDLFIYDSEIFMQKGGNEVQSKQHRRCVAEKTLNWTYGIWIVRREKSINLLSFFTRELTCLTRILLWRCMFCKIGVSINPTRDGPKELARKLKDIKKKKYVF